MITVLQQKPPKSIEYLSNFLDNTERTIYRYLDLIKELGFDVQRDEEFKFLIATESNTERQLFTLEEAKLMRDLLTEAPGDNKLKNNLLKKIYLKSEISMQGDKLVNAHNGKIIESLTFAMEHNLQVILKNYHSLSQMKIYDRKVEPIQFTENYKLLCAFDVKTKENKFYKLDRLSGVELTKKPIMHKAYHKYEKLDAFGFAPNFNSKKHKVELNMSLKAYILLKEEFPMTVNYIVNKGKYYKLKIDVNDPRPIIRFIMGLLDDVEVVGSVDFQEFVLDDVKRLLL